MYQHSMPAANPGPPKLRVYTKEEWEEKRSVFVELYSQDYTLATVRELMATDHSFYATEAQYKKKIKAWGLERNIDKATALGILRKESKRKYVEDKETIFKYKDNEINGDRITLLRKRHKGILDHEGLGSDPRKWEMEQVDTPPYVAYLTPPPVDESPEVAYDMPSHSSHDPQILKDEGIYGGALYTDDIPFITDEIHKTGLGYEILDQQAANISGALDCGKTFDHKAQHDYLVKETSSDRREQSQGPLNTSSSTPLISGVEEQSVEIHSSSGVEGGNDNIEFDVDLEDDEPSLSRPSLLGNGSGNDNEHISLHEAAYQGREEIVILLLKQGHDISEEDDEKCTALHWAASDGHEKVVQLLLQSGIDASEKDSDGRTALHMAASDGHEKVVQLLLQSGIDASAKSHLGWTALHEAAFGGHEKVVQLLLQSGIDASAKGHLGWTALHEAASCGHEKVV